MYLLCQEFRCWNNLLDYVVYIKPVLDKDQCGCLFTLMFLKTTVRNNVSAHFYSALLTLYVSTPINGHLQVIRTQNILKVTTVYANV
jgi:hypothetical protein